MGLSFRLFTMKKLKNLQLLMIGSFILISSCKKFQHRGSGGGGGGSVPTAEDLNNYIDRLTTPENKTCTDVIVDRQKPKKFPIIYPSGKYQWKNDYSNSISKQFDKDYMRVLKYEKIDEGDLSLIHCKGYNYATDEEKKQFWVLFLSAVSFAESGFYKDDEYSEGNGTVSTGLLQIDPKAASDWCQPVAEDIDIPITIIRQNGKDIKKRFFSNQHMHDPNINLQCGLLMMQRQIMGVKTEPNNKYYKNKLFTTGPDYWYWSTLADKNSDKKSDIINWFSVHAQRQLKFCNRTNPIDGYTPALSTKFKGMKCDEVINPQEKSNCEKYLLNIKIENQIFNPSVGENPTSETCSTIDNTGRQLNKTSGGEISAPASTESNNTMK